MEIRPYIMKNPVMNYAWGTKGKDAFIPRLLKLPHWDQTTPWAELWMGAHPKAPSIVHTSVGEISLRNLIKEYPLETLGNRILSKFGDELPFLFKVLSAAEILSIQAHPNKQQAKILHEQDPEHYPDDNHKPELAIAIDTLEALAGFKANNKLLKISEVVPEIKKTVGNLSPSENVRKEFFLRLMELTHSEPSIIKNTVKNIKNRLGISQKILLPEETLFMEASKKYPENDIGLLLIFALNKLSLLPGEGVFIPAGMLHAYIRGNIVECMANSDNVVRAGLTPKFKDIKTLTKIVNYSAEPKVLRPESEKGFFEYKIPVDEFVVYRWHTEKGKSITFNSVSSPTICLLIKGEITLNWNTTGSLTLSEGTSIFIPASLKEFYISSNQESLAFFVMVP